jgi:hypothetical protein
MTYHKTEYQTGHFEETLTIYYRYADLLADEKFQMAVQEINFLGFFFIRRLS